MANRKKVIRKINPLKPCFCGRTPATLYITDTSQGRNWAAISGSCCDQWIIEFQSESSDGKEVYKQAMLAWNAAPRSK